jgi:hypothetical protein
MPINADRYQQLALRALMKIAMVIHGLYSDVRVDMSGAEGLMHWKGILVIIVDVSNKVRGQFCYI